MSEIELYEILDEQQPIGIEIHIHTPGYIWHFNVDFRTSPVLPMPGKFRVRVTGRYRSGEQVQIDSYERRLVCRYPDSLQSTANQRAS